MEDMEGWKCMSKVDCPPLPLDLTDDILKRLVLLDQCRVTTVCKEWKNIVDKHLPSAWAPKLAVVSHLQGQPLDNIAFDIAKQQWVRVPASFFQGDKCTQLAQSKGLYVYSVMFNSRSMLEHGNDMQTIGPASSQQTCHLVVSNPVTGQVTWLPPTSIYYSDSSYMYDGEFSKACHEIPESPAVHLQILEEGRRPGTTTYKIICFDVHYPYLKVYDSRIGNWSSACAWGPNMVVYYCFIFKDAVVLGTNIFAIAYDSHGTMRKFLCSLRLEDKLEDSNWQQVCHFDVKAARLHLALCDDKLIVLASETMDGSGGATVYVLSKESQLLLHEADVPTWLAAQINMDYDNPSMMKFRCSVIGQGHHFVIFVPDFKGSGDHLIAYDLNTKHCVKWAYSSSLTATIGWIPKLINLEFGLLNTDTVTKIHSLCSLLRRVKHFVHELCWTSYQWCRSLSTITEGAN